MIPAVVFQNCWDRIRRAELHRDAFATAWNGFIEDAAEPYSTWVNVEDDGTGEIHVAPWDEYSLPTELAFEFGELLYQPRAALDGAVYAAAILESGQDPPPDEENLEFPLRDSPSKFKNAAWHLGPIRNNDGLMKLVEAVQPHAVPDIDPEMLILNVNRTLGILNDWARKDRHRHLHIVGSWASNANPLLIIPDGCELEYMFVTHDGLLEQDSLIARFKLAGFVRGMKVQANPNLAIDVAVDEPPHPCADNDTLGARIRSMIVWARTIVMTFEQSFKESK